MLHDPAVLQDVCDRMGIRMVVLFGSHAPGGVPPRPHSDVDVAVAFGPSEPPTFGELLAGLSEAFPRRAIDPARLADADPLFRWEIMDRGVLLHGDVDDFFELRAFAYRDFVDSADLRDLERVLFEKKMARIADALGAAP